MFDGTVTTVDPNTLFLGGYGHILIVFGIFILAAVVLQRYLERRDK